MSPEDLDAFGKPRKTKRRPKGKTIEEQKANRSAWRKDNRDKLNGYAAARRARNPEEYKAKELAYRLKHRDKIRAGTRRVTLRYHYGMTTEQYDAMLAAQGGVCAICGSSSPRTFKAKYFAIDHCHKTDKIRGLLCLPCNSGIGHLKDDIDLLETAVRYLASVSI